MNVSAALLPDLWWALRDDAKLKLRNLSLMFYFEILYFTTRLLHIVFQFGDSLLRLFLVLDVEVRKTSTCLLQYSCQCDPLTFCVALSLLRFLQLCCEAIILLPGIFQQYL